MVPPDLTLCIWIGGNLGLLEGETKLEDVDAKSEDAVLSAVVGLAKNKSVESDSRKED